MKVRNQSEIRANPLTTKCRMSMILERSDFDALKIAAFKLNTTCNEIVRTLIHDYVCGGDDNALHD